MMGRARLDLSGREPSSIKDEVQLLRWILIVASAYIVLFSEPASSKPLLAKLFVCFYLPSNMVLHVLAPRIQADETFLGGVVLFDTLCVSLGIVLTGAPTGDFFLLYFLILFIAALADRLVVVLGVALLMSLIHIYTVAQFSSAGALMESGRLLRIPFLFVVALAFGLLVRRVRSAEGAAEEAQRQSRLQTDAAAMLAHDIKNPLFVIQGLTEVLRSTPATSAEDRRGLIERIEANAASATTLAINFVDAARLEIGALRISPARTSLNVVVQHAVDSQMPACGPRQIELRVDLDPELPDIDLDVRAFDRVVANLLSNAIKYSPERGVVRISTSVRGNLAVLSVRDQGPGIPPAEMPKLFQRYSTLAASLRDSTGLGLFIVRTITEGHQGRVSVECPPEGGSVFEIALPIPSSGTAS